MRFWATLLALVLIAFAVVGMVRGWGPDQWGPYAEWFAGAVTFAAVVVALRASSQGRRDRLVDHELVRRRECINALGDLWGAVMQVGLEVQSFNDYVKNLPGEFNPNYPRKDNVPQDRPGDPLCVEFGNRLVRLMDRWVVAVEPQVFISLALLEDTPLEDGVKAVITDFRAINNELLPEINNVFCTGRRPDEDPLKNAWTQLVTRRQAHLDLAREHFSLKLDDAEKAALRRR